jgi:hypothetical protein
MPTKPARRTAGAARRLKKLWRRSVKAWRGARRWWRPAPRPAKFIMAALVVLLLWLGINWIYQVLRKPSELFFPVSGTLNKAPAETWAEYAPIFKKFSTEVMTPDFLAAIAQVEGAHLLALVLVIAALRGIPAGLERRRHVSDYRREFCRSAPLLHSRSRRRSGRPLE